MGCVDIIRIYGSGLLSLLYPRLCVVCGCKLVEGERHLCLECRANLPRTGFHRDPFNPIHQRLAPEPVERGAAMFYYHRQDQYGRIVRRAKYNDHPELARDFGQWYATELMAEGFFEGIDKLLAVPMHPFKQWRRGYNQAHEIAVGVSRATGLPIADNLTAAPHESQTRRDHYLRYLNVRTIYGVERPGELAGCHVLLIDDVVTSGATLLSCIRALRQAVGAIRVSVLTLGSTHLN